MKLSTSSKAGFTLVEIMIVVAIIGTASQKNACIANLKQMDGAKASWALEQKKNNADTPGDTDLFGATSYIRDKPACPGGGTYALNQVDQKPTCTQSSAGHSL